MKRNVMVGTCGVAVLLAAALVVGCGRDASGPERSAGPAGPLARLTEGAVVRATLHDALAVPREGAAPAVLEVEPQQAEAAVAHGRAVDARCGALLAAGAWDGSPREFRYTDAAAHEHRLSVARGAGGGPVQTVRYAKDGQVLAEVVYRWLPAGEGYVLGERVISLFSHGRVVVQHVRRADALAVSAPAPAAAGVPGRPPVLYQEMVGSGCLKEWAAYIGASATLILAGELYTLIPTPATASALIAAAGVWEKALDNLLTCQVNNAV